MLYLPEDIAEEMIEHARKEAPLEACGILAGRKKRVEKSYPMSNTDQSPRSYFMDPEEQLRAMKEIRNSKLEMVGIYHSHPASPAYPSARDVELAFYPELSQVIVSLQMKRNPELGSFRINEGKIIKERLIIV